MKAILTGATGMVGEGVLNECLQSPEVDRVLVVGRKPCGVIHPKVTEVLHDDFQDLGPISTHLSGYDACFFCLGVSSIGMKEPEFFTKTYTLTMHMASILSKRNPGMIFCYISGSGTDSSEKGRVMWARVKGKTENDLMKLSFKRVYNFRPGYMQPTAGMKNTLSSYKYMGWMYPGLRTLFPGHVSTLKELAIAMIRVATKGYEKQILEVKDIVALAKTEVTPQTT